MRFFGNLSIAAAVLMAGTSLSAAADIIPEPDPIPEVVPVAQASGWYLRGDVGYSHLDPGRVTYGQHSPGAVIVEKVDGADYGTEEYVPIGYYPGHFGWNDFSKADLDDEWSFQGGIGYQVNDYFRVDFTAAHMNNSDFNGRSSSDGTFDCGLLSTDNDQKDKCSVKDKAKLSYTTLMANGYFDLGNFSGFTPYVGGGIGGARVKWDDLENDIKCKGGGDCKNMYGDDYGKVHDRTHDGDDNDWRFAWSVHAGASYDLTCNTKLDAGYTYTRIEGGDMFNWNSDAVLKGTQGRTDDIEVHTGRVGLRYQFGGCEQPYVAQEVPIYK